MEQVSMWVSAKGRSQQSPQEERKGDRWQSEAPRAHVTDRLPYCVQGHQGKCESQHTDPLTEYSEINKSMAAKRKGRKVHCDTKVTWKRPLWRSQRRTGPDKGGSLGKRTLISRKQSRNKGAWERNQRRVSTSTRVWSETQAVRRKRQSNNNLSNLRVMTKLDSWTGVRVRIQKLALESEFKRHGRRGFWQARSLEETQNPGP